MFKTNFSFFPTLSDVQLYNSGAGNRILKKQNDMHRWLSSVLFLERGMLRN